MEQDYKLIGAPCAVRGPYTFYKAFKYTKNGVTNVLTINEFFFVKLWNDSDFVSIGELRLLWEDQSCDKALASLRLYILPENTPDGRVGDVHGEDEVLAITEKVIIKLEDLLTWITDASDWHWGLSSVWTKRNVAAITKTEPVRSVEQKINGSMNSMADDDKENYIRQSKSNTLEDCSAIDYSDVFKEKAQVDLKNWDTRTGVLVLSYSRYCRYRALLKRLEGVHNDWLRDDMISALGGFATTYRTTKILFCRDTFDYPELEGHELLCNHLAPKLRSRIPKKKKTLYPSPDVSESEASSEYGTEDDERSSSASSCSSSNNSNNSLAARFPSNYETGVKRIDSKKLPHNLVSPAQQAFTQNLYAFMKARLTPIGRLPLIGNKELNLYEFYNKVKLLGSYASVTNNKLWKYVFEELGGDRGDPSMATLMRKYYEKFLLPYEQHMLQQMKHTSANQSTSAVVSGVGSAVIKPQCLPTMSPDCRYQADRRKVTTTIRPVPASVRIIESRIPGMTVAAKPAGDKENIPLSDKRKFSSSTNTPEVIDLCAEEESTSRMPEKSVIRCDVDEDDDDDDDDVPEVIDLCEESPIRRSVPSIAATIMPRKRKLDILREGGLEVTPVAATGSVANSSVTITRKLPPASVAISAIKSGETSLEIIDTKYTTQQNQRARISRTPSQILDLRTMRGGGGGGSMMSDDGDVVVGKKFSPNLGPNIEISLVANDPVGGGGGGGGGGRREEKKRKPIPLPIPALRKISTGELSVKNFTHNEDHRKPKVSLCKKLSSDVTLTKAPKVSSSVTTTSTEAHHSSNDDASYVPVNQSFYLAALYNSIFPGSGTAQAFVTDDGDPTNPYQIQLTPQQINYVRGAFMHQPDQEIDMNPATDAFAQKFTNMLKNGTVSIVENYEKILPD